MHDCMYVLTIFMQSICSDDRISPTWSRKYDYSANGMCPHMKDRVCTLQDGMCPRVEVLVQTCLWVFLGDPTGTEILRFGISLARRSNSVAGTFPSQRPDFVASWRDVPSLGSKCESNSVVRIFLSWRRDFQVPLWDKQPLLRNYASNQVPNISESKQISPSRHPIPNKTIARQSRQDLNK